MITNTSNKINIDRRKEKNEKLIPRPLSNLVTVAVGLVYFLLTPTIFNKYLLLDFDVVATIFVLFISLVYYAIIDSVLVLIPEAIYYAYKRHKIKRDKKILERYGFAMPPEK